MSHSIHLLKHGFALLIALTISASMSADHLSDEFLVSAKLTGDQEVPEVTTDAVGVASLTLNNTWDSLFINISVNKLSGPITGIHIHDGLPGVNGPVVTNLSSNVVKNRIIATVAGDDLTPELISGILSGRYYLNVHTDENPNGEIRGQLLLETDYGFRANLTTDQQTMMVTGDALGLVYADLSKNGTMLELRAVADDLSGDIVAAHLHFGMMGEDGPVAVDLMPFISGNSIIANLDATMPADLIENLKAGNVYLNIHTEANPNGEIRGNLMMDEYLTFDSWITTDQEVMNPMNASGYGAATLSLNTTFDTIWYDVQVTELTGAITGAHLHDGEFGTDGDVLVGLTPNVEGNTISGMITDGDVTLDLVQKLLKGGVYINIHTDMNPAGEVRGQVYRLMREGYAFALESNQEVPRKFAVAKGGGMVSVDRNQSNAHVMVVLSDLTGPLTGAHFHNAAMGMNGDVLYNLTPWFEGMEDSDAAFGYWTADDETPFTTMSSLAFRNEMMYVNIHTEARPAGEIRGQVLRGAKEFMHQMEMNGMNPMDPMFENGVLFSAKLTGDQEVPAVDTDALGVAGLLLSPTRDTLFVNVNVDGLSGPITGIHIHEGEAGENGDVVFNLTEMLSGKQARGFITEFDLAQFIKNQYYVNVHTDENPGGEIRGQIGFEADWTFIGDLNGDQEVPSVETAAFGKGVVNLSKDEANLQVRIVTTGLSGEITGAHLHVGAAGTNGDVVANLTDFININSIEANIDPSAYLDELKAGNIYINVHTEANPNGEIRGQLMLAEALVFDAWMNGAQEVPEAEVPGTGVASLWLNDAWDALNFDIVVDQISGPITGIHIHNALLGENGDVVVNITPSVDGNRIMGEVSGADLTPELLTAMLNGETYLNLHTAAFPNGEIRGQVYRLARQGYSYVLCGEQEVPAVDAMAYGGGILSIDRDYTTAHVMFTSTELSGPLTGAHLHNAPAGENGDVLYGLTDILVDNSGFVYQPIDEMGAMETLNGNIYLNLHTSENAGGEIRGQIDNMMDCPEVMVVGVEEFLVDAGLNAYPVPFMNQLTIEFDASVAGDVSIELADMTGRVVKSVFIKNASKRVTFDTSDLASGLYVVEINSENVNTSKKVMK